MIDTFFIERVDTFLDEVRKEMLRATKEHGRIHTAHEAYGIIKEEFEEFWDEVKKKNPMASSLLEELKQTAAMCLRTVIDLELDKWAFAE